MHNRQSLEVGPVVGTFLGLRQLIARDRDLTIDQPGRCIPVIDALEACDDCLALPLTLPDLQGMPVASMPEKPAAIVQYRFAWPGM